MITGLRAFCHAIDLISEWSGRIFAWLIVPLTLLVVFEVITRRFLGSPTIWTFETTQFIYGAHFMLLAGYTLLHGAHVGIDVFTKRLPSKVQAGITSALYIVLFFPFVAVLTQKGILFAASSWQMAETSWSAFHPPLYPIKTVIPVAGFLLGIQGLSEFIKSMVFLVKGERIC